MPKDNRLDAHSDHTQILQRAWILFERVDDVLQWHHVMTSSIDFTHVCDTHFVVGTLLLYLYRRKGLSAYRAQDRSQTFSCLYTESLVKRFDPVIEIVEMVLSSP